jgi:hypothetical protein
VGDFEGIKVEWKGNGAEEMGNHEIEIMVDEVDES